MYTPSRPKLTLTPQVESPYVAAISSAVAENDASPFNKRKGSVPLSHVIETTSTYQLLAFGSTLPVQVAEFIAVYEPCSMLANVEPSGWAWLVKSNILLAWKCSTHAARKAVSCFELPLASTELKHDPRLCCVITQQAPSDPVTAMNVNTAFLNVSPEGVVRVWTNIARPGNFLEKDLQLDGKQCHRCVSLQHYGCLVVTTTNELYLITVAQTSIAWKQLSSSTGMLSGLGRRVSSFWYRPAVSQNHQQLPCITAAANDPEELEVCFYVVVGSMLQKWAMSGFPRSKDKLLVEVDVKSVLRSSLAAVAEQTYGDDGIVVVDAASTGSGVVLLAHAPSSNQLHQLFVANVNIAADGRAILEHLQMLPHYVKDEEALNNKLKLILCPGSYEAYVCSVNVLLVSAIASGVQMEILKVELKNQQLLQIIGSGCYGHQPVFLSKRQGLMTLKIQASPQPLRILSSLSAAGQTPKTKEDLHKPGDAYISDFNDDAFSTLRKMLLAFTGGTPVSKLSWSSLAYSSDEVARAVRQVSVDIVNAKPASDPRWVTGVMNQFSPSSSVLIQNQVHDKEQIHAEFMKLLDQSGVWQKLGEKKAAVKAELLEHSEKLQVAITLLDIYFKFQELLTASISKCIEFRDCRHNTADLSDQDIFFAKVTDVDEVFERLCEHERFELENRTAVQQQVQLIASVSEVIITCFNAAWQYRQAKNEIFELGSGQDTAVVYLPWTGSSKGHNCRKVLKEQIKWIIDLALPNVDSTKTGAALSQQVVLLADLLLDGFVSQIRVYERLNSPQGYDVLNKQYEEEREFVTSSLVNLGFVEHACSLAEKYEDFKMLIYICNKTNDLDKLNKYKAMFGGQGFLDALYDWYMNQGLLGKLLSQEASPNLASFLSNHQNLSWLYYIGERDFSKASSLLKRLGNEENTYLARQKTLLVLSNLALLATDAPEEILRREKSSLDDALELIDYQENLPTSVLQELGKSSPSLPPRSANELIDLYVGERNARADEACCKSALNLLKFLSGEERKNASLKIWSRAVLLDRWQEPVHVDPVAVISGKTFFKCLKYASNDESHRLSIPKLKELLTSSDVFSSEICTNAALHQLKVCYEVVGLQHLSDVS